MLCVRKAVLFVTSLLFVIGTIGRNIGPALLDEHPAWVLILSSGNRNLFGSVPYIGLLPYLVIGFTRVLIAGVALYLVGRWYGSRALGWVEGNMGDLPAIYRWTQRIVDKAGSVAVVLMPGSNIVCLMLGHRKMPPRRFVPLLMVGIAIKLAVLWQGGRIFEDQIRWFLNYVEKYQWWVVIGLFAISILQSVRRVRPRPE